MMLEVAHALGKTIREVEDLTPDEVATHAVFLSVKAEEKRDAMEAAKSGSGRRGPMRKVIEFKRE